MRVEVSGSVTKSRGQMILARLFLLVFLIFFGYLLCQQIVDYKKSAPVTGTITDFTGEHTETRKYTSTTGAGKTRRSRTKYRDVTVFEYDLSYEYNDKEYVRNYESELDYDVGDTLDLRVMKDNPESIIIGGKTMLIGLGITDFTLLIMTIALFSVPLKSIPKRRSRRRRRSNPYDNIYK